MDRAKQLCVISKIRIYIRAEGPFITYLSKIKESQYLWSLFTVLKLVFSNPEIIQVQPEKTASQVHFKPVPICSVEKYLKK